MALKVIGTTKSCRGCPFRQYYSAGVYECGKTEERLPYNHGDDFIASNCPLPDYSKNDK